MEIYGVVIFAVVVGEKGFEPSTPWSQTRCATRLRHSPTITGSGVLPVQGGSVNIEIAKTQI